METRLPGLMGKWNGGDIVDVYYGDGKLAGKGLYQPKIPDPCPFTDPESRKRSMSSSFITASLQAWQYRQKIGYTENCRLVFGEADLLPALVIDKFNDYFVIQTLSLGMDTVESGHRESHSIYFFPQRHL
jgi:23S rRNA (cytosine1962-C5)-methyltransferase